MFKQLGLWVAVVVLAVSATVSRGAVSVGDKPQWAAKDINGDKIGSAALAGKMVLIDFWATWCGPCMREVPHMVKVNEQYGPQGLVIVGISLDEDKAAWEQVIREKGMKWTHSLDSQNTPELAGPFGADSIPRTFLISPEGEVLWTGHPMEMDGPLEKAFKKYTVHILDKKALAEATAALDKAEAAVKSKDLPAAARAVAKLPAAAPKEKALAPRIEQLQKALAAYASGAFAEAEDLLGKKDYVAAAARLEPIAHLPGLAESKKAAEKVAAIKAMPEAAAAFEAEDKAEQERAKAAKGEEALAAARKLKADQKDEQAYLAFKDVARQFAASPAGAAAAKEAAVYEKDASFVKRATLDASEVKARVALKMANNYKNAGRFDLAKTKYQSVMDQFPGTPSADEAKTALATLPRE